MSIFGPNSPSNNNNNNTSNNNNTKPIPPPEDPSGPFYSQFEIPVDATHELFSSWVNSLWFTPSDFLPKVKVGPTRGTFISSTSNLLTPFLCSFLCPILDF